MDPIPKDTFDGFDVNQKLSVLYDYTLDTNETVDGIKTTLQNKKKADAAKTLIGGFLGGFVAMLAKWAVWK